MEHHNSNDARKGPVKGVIFDMGGVIYPHPKQFIVDYCLKTLGLTKGIVLKLFDYSDANTTLSLWEMGDIKDMDQVDSKLAEQCRQLTGTNVDMTGFSRVLEKELLSYEPYGEMIDCIRRLRHIGCKTALLTNNMYLSDGPIQPLDESLFDAVVQSCIVNIRKPDPRIFELALDRLQLEPADVVFLDDIRVNVEAARQVGIRSIEVVDPLEAINELEELVGSPLRNR